MFFAVPRRRTRFALLFVLALLPRLAFLWEFRASDYFSHPSVDEAEYRDWALEIAGGDFVGKQVFYGSPVYPYFLGFVFRILGPDLSAARTVQAFLGAARAPLVAAAGEIAFGPVAGTVAGILAALYRTNLFYDAFLMKECLALLIQDAALLVLLIALGIGARGATRRGASPLDASGQGTGSARGTPGERATASPRLVLGSGALVGLAILAREYLAPFALIAAALIAARERVAGAPRGVWARRAARAAAIFLAGVFLPLLPVALRNQLVAGEFVLLTSQGGQNFYLGNSRANETGLVTFPANVRSDPQSLEADFRALASYRSGRPLGPTETSAFWLRAALGEMAADPLHAASLFVKKALLAVNVFEVPNVYSVDYFARISRVLAWNPIRFALLLPLAAAGLVLTGRDPARRAAALAPALLLATVAAALVLFYVSDRYRLPATTPLFLFAGVAVAGLADALRGGGWRAWRAWRQPVALRRIAPPFAVAALAIGVSHLTVLPEGGRGDAMPPANLARALAQEGRYEEALARYREAFEIEKDTDFALFGSALVYAELHRYDEAIAALRLYVAKNPLSAQGYYNLGIALFASGKPDSAAKALETAVRIEPYFAEAFFNLGAVRQSMGDLESARSAYETATRAAPGLARAWNNLGTTLVALRRSEDARAAFGRAMADTAYVEPRANLAALELAENRPADAARLFEWILAREKRREALLGLGKARAQLGDAAGSRAALELFLKVAPADDSTRAEAARVLSGVGGAAEDPATPSLPAPLTPRGR